MARFARVIAPGCAYHVTHRGNRQGNVFLTHQDRVTYRRWLAEYCDRYAMEVWAYCLMTNHVHLLVVGHQPRSLANAIGRCHMRYARHLNRRMRWSGHLWANRFYSTPLDDAHLLHAARYIETNPLRAGLATHPAGYLWSSARAHCRGLHDPLLSASRPFPGLIKNWSEWLVQDSEPQVLDLLRANTKTGRPTGSTDFILRLELALERSLTPPKRGRSGRKGCSTTVPNDYLSPLAITPSIPLNS